MISKRCRKQHCNGLLFNTIISCIQCRNHRHSGKSPCKFFRNYKWINADKCNNFKSF